MALCPQPAELSQPWHITLEHLKARLGMKKGFNVKKKILFIQTEWDGCVYMYYILDFEAFLFLEAKKDHAHPSMAAP